VLDWFRNLFKKKPDSIFALLPPPEVLALLDAQKFALLIRANNGKGRRDLEYAKLAMICGVVALLGCFSLSAYVGMHGLEKLSYVFAAPPVLGLILKVFRLRL
jgi:hypothetical protein